ncbi:MAG: hypothetical protein WB646_19075 [Steroidobacteraceae bacterium]
MSRKARDYPAEYTRRIARGAGRGVSRSQARGHPKVAERHVSAKTPSVSYDRKLEEGVKALRKGKSLTAAARELHVSPERLRSYAKALPFVKKRKGRFFVGPDPRQRRVVFYSEGQLVKAVVQGYEPAQLAGSYWDAVGDFLETNDRNHLAPFIGAQITDVRGRTYSLETRPNVLYRLANADGETFRANLPNRCLAKGELLT